jgi:hypothetical protein
MQGPWLTYGLISHVQYVVWSQKTVLTLMLTQSLHQTVFSAWLGKSAWAMAIGVFGNGLEESLL